MQFWAEYWETIVFPGILWVGIRLTDRIDRKRRDRRVLEAAVSEGLVPRSVAEAYSGEAGARPWSRWKSLLSNSDDCVEMSNLRAFADVRYRRCQVERELAALRQHEEQLRASF
jgi:hypothetical protein